MGSFPSHTKTSQVKDWSKPPGFTVVAVVDGDTEQREDTGSRPGCVYSVRIGFLSYGLVVSLAPSHDASSAVIMIQTTALPYEWPYLGSEGSML